MKRPIGVKVLVALEIIYALAICTLFAGFRIVTGPPPEWWYNTFWAAPVWVFILARALWARKRWAWIVALIYAAITIIGGFVWLLTRGWTGILDVVCNVPIIYVLTRPQMKAFFGKPS